MEGMTLRPTEQADLPAAQESMHQQLQRMSEAMQAMAGMLRATHESMEALRQQVRVLEKVTPAQATAINAAIRERASALCDAYKIHGREKSVATMIRKDLRVKFGAVSVRELPRCDYASVCQQLQLWDDYKALKALRGADA